MPVVTLSRSAVALATLLTASTFGLGAVTSATAATVCGPAGGYAAPIATTTSLTLTRSVEQYGSVNVATVRVTSGAGTPSGTVRLTVSNNAASYTATLDGNGVARRQLPRTLTALRTYTVTARYDGQGTCQPSGPVSKYLTVVRAATSVRGLQAADVRSGGRPDVTGRVVSATGVTPRGQVRVSLVHNRKVVQQRVVGLRLGRFATTLQRVSARGTWKVRAAMLPNRTFRGSHATTTIRVTRR